MPRRRIEPNVMGLRPTTRDYLTFGLAMSLIFPGLGFAFIPAVLFGDGPLGLLVWVVAAGLVPVVLLWLLPREHRVVGDELRSTTVRGTTIRSLRDVVSIAPAPLRLPAAIVRFVDGSRVRVFGPTITTFLHAVMAEATSADNRLPPGNWLRSRRLIWFALFIVVGIAEA